MNILVTGATGFLGSRITEHLASKSWVESVVATGRKISFHKKINKPKIKYVLGDLVDPLFVESLLDNKIDVVINCASFSSPWGTFKLFHESNVITQRNLIHSSQKSNIQRFIYISTPSIYFNFKNRLNITEVSPLPTKQVNNYSTTKLEAERLLKKSSLDHIILRPRALIGKGDTVIMPRLIRSYKEGKLKIMGTGDNIVDLTSVSNMVDAIVLSLSTKNVNESYNISNGEPVNLWNSINSVLTKIGEDSITKKIPYHLLYSIANFLELKSKLTKSTKEPIITKYSVGVLAKSFSFNINKAKTMLGYEPKQNTNDAIQEFAIWYNKMNYDKN